MHLITRLELGGAQLATLAQVRQQVQRASACYLLYGPGGQLDAAARALPGVTCLSVPALQGRLQPQFRRCDPQLDRLALAYQLAQSAHLPQPSWTIGVQA